MKVPFLLAPMAEISHRAFRELIEHFGGCDEYFTEMISAGALLADGPYEKWYIDSGPVSEKTVFQLVGSDSNQILKAAEFLDRSECIGIDINMGCSAPVIRKSGGGAAWMASIDKAGELISRIRPVVKRRLSVKLRIGFNDDFEYLTRFCRRLEAEGTELIILHPRTVMEKFKRLARWNYIERLKSELKIPVAGNGDIGNSQELLNRADCCDAVMVGRGAVRQPWIFSQARAMSVSDSEGKPIIQNIPSIIETGLLFLEFLVRYQPLDFNISRARRFFGYFCENLKWGNYLKNQINREVTISGIERVWQNYFKENNPE